MSIYYNTEKFIEKSKLLYGNKFTYENSSYVNNSTHIEINCVKHGPFWPLPNNHYNGDGGCKSCLKEKFSLGIAAYLSKAQEKYNNKYSYENSVYINMFTSFEITCKIHGSFWTTPHQHLRRDGECPSCGLLRSKGEMKLINILKFLKIDYKEQYKIDECKNIQTLKFDVGVFKDNKFFGVIEYQGIQHYKPIKYFGGEKKLKIVQFRDKIKYDFCNKNDIPLLLIPYWENKNMENIISNFLN